MVGNVVNMAARLMQAAERELGSGTFRPAILCDQETEAAVQLQANQGYALAETLAFQALAPIAVKGRDEPLAVFRPRSLSGTRPSLARRQRPRNGPPMVGRAAERELLLARLQDLVDGRNGQCPVVLLEGEAGAGKTMLVGELAGRARELNVPLLGGAAHSLEKTTPFFAWRPIFRRLFEIDSMPDDPRARRAAVLRRLPAGPEERGFPARALHLAPLLNDILELDFPVNSQLAALSPGTRRRVTRLFLLRLLQRAAAGRSGRRRPYCLVLEDAQWLDRDSWALALSVSQTIQPLLMLLVARSLEERAMATPLPAAAQRLIGAPGTCRLPLLPLTLAETEELLCRHFGGATVPGALVELIWRKTGGHPFFSQELARAYFEKGWLLLDKRGCRFATRLDELAGSAMPANVYKAISDRFDRLAPPYQAVLKAASAIGRSFTAAGLAALLACYGQPTAGVEARLEKLVELGLINRRPGESEPAYCFCADLFQEAIYSLMPLAQRRQLQARLASIPAEPEPIL
jgi:predicted ATPase